MRWRTPTAPVVVGSLSGTRCGGARPMLEWADGSHPCGRRRAGPGALAPDAPLDRIRFWGVVVNTELDDMGPVDYLVLEFPGNRMTGGGFPLLLDLVDRGIIRILDLVFVRKDADGSVAGLELQELGEGVDLTVFEGASSGLLDHTDLQDAAAALEADTSAAILVYENTWAAPLARELRRGGASMVASGRIPVQALLASLEAIEQTTPPTSSGPAAV